MSIAAQKLLKEFRSLTGPEQRELAAVIATEVRSTEIAEKVRVLEEVTGKYRYDAQGTADLDEAWAEGILHDKRAE